MRSQESAKAGTAPPEADTGGTWRGSWVTSKAFFGKKLEVAQIPTFQGSFRGPRVTPKHFENHRLLKDDD